MSRAMTTSGPGAALDPRVLARAVGHGDLRVPGRRRSTALELAEGAEPAEALEGLDGWCREQRVRLVSCRLDHLRLRESMALEAPRLPLRRDGLRPRCRSGSTAIEPDLAHRGPAGDRADDLPADRGDRGHDAFTTGRFLLDARLDPELSRRRYATWVRTSLGVASDQTVLKAELDGDLVGFFIVEREAGRSACTGT